MSSKIYDLYWEGPWTPTEILSKPSDDLKELLDRYVLYQIYGRHSIYGPNRLLYVGRTDQGAARIQQHENEWLYAEPDECQIRLATAGVWESWGKWESDDGRYDKLEDQDLVKGLEALLIKSSRPAFNKREELPANLPSLRIFNTGRFGDLRTEISGAYWFGGKERQQ